jgi:two-component system cell cycle sensor histidine kinase/response regulator CckA
MPSHDLPLVLIVDDEPAMAELGKRALASAGYRVIVAHSGAEALTISSVERVQLLLTDLNMPVMSGRQLAAELRKAHDGLKILYLTGHADQLFGPLTLLEADEAFLEKPVSAAALRDAVAMHLFGTLARP